MQSLVRNLLFSISFLCSSSFVHAQVSGELLAAENGAQPGSRISVALKLTHEPGWHTYWVSPGIGEATSIDWELPKGWVASEIDWPVPVKIFTQDGEVSGHGFEDVALLPIDLIVADDAPVGESITLNASVKWLMCEYEICIPGGTELELPVAIVGSAPSPNPAVQAALDATPMPEAGENFDISATRNGELITLSGDGDATFSDPHFFSHDELIWYDAVQEYELDEGSLTAILPIDSYYEPKFTTLSLACSSFLLTTVGSNGEQS